MCLTRTGTRTLTPEWVFYILFQEWKACVCVLVQGAAWQFKGWEWDQPVTLFQNGENVNILLLNLSFKYFSWASNDPCD